MYKHILVPTDGSTVSARAEKAALEIAKKFKARITVVHVVAPWSPQSLGEIRALGPAPMSESEYLAASEKRANALMKKVADRARRARVKVATSLLYSNEPGRALVDTVKSARCDLVVMGSSSRTGIERIFLGSVASDVLQGSTVPTLVCR